MSYQKDQHYISNMGNIGTSNIGNSTDIIWMMLFPILQILISANINLYF